MATIKKITALVLTAVMMAGCNRVKSDYSVNGISVVTIDSCEYLGVLTYGYNYTYNHKGNCKYCQERRQKELKELISEIKKE